MSQSNQNDSKGKHLIGTAVATIAADEGPSDFNDMVIAFLCRHAKGRKVLDIGCVNHNPENYRSKFWVHKALCAVASHCVGLDLYEPGVIRLREQGYDVRLSNAENFDLGEKFDCVVAGEIIEHVGNVSGLLDSAKRHLAPGGILLITTPNPWYWRFVLKAALSPDVHPNAEHVAWFCQATLRQLLARHGFEIVEFARASRSLPDRIMPLPPGLKAPTLLLAARPALPDVAA
jgi:SAM-dependent methyltransferase